MIENEKVCSECAYHKHLKEYMGKINGECRFNPPVESSRFPKVAPDMWCGKFKRKFKPGIEGSF